MIQKEGKKQCKNPRQEKVLSSHYWYKDKLTKSKSKMIMIALHGYINAWYFSSSLEFWLWTYSSQGNIMLVHTVHFASSPFMAWYQIISIIEMNISFLFYSQSLSFRTECYKPTFPYSARLPTQDLIFRITSTVIFLWWLIIFKFNPLVFYSWLNFSFCCILATMCQQFCLR